MEISRRGFVRNAAALAGAAALYPFRVEARGKKDTLAQLVEAGKLREGVRNIYWAPLMYVDGALAPGQVFKIADYMNATMAAGASSRTVDTQKEYIDTQDVTHETNPFELGEVNKIVTAMQATAAHVQHEFISQNGLKGVDVRTRYGANIEDSPRATQIKFRLGAGTSVLYVHSPNEHYHEGAISNLYAAWQQNQLKDVFIMTNNGELALTTGALGAKAALLRNGEENTPVSDLAGVLSHAKLGSGDAHYLLSLVEPNADYAKQAISDPGVGNELFVGFNTHSFETFPVR
ncbi:hypothetical protein CO051_05510 [Candidatus Roizmanbacteria bacterium CG_4_9_14_0_2_um_filter_39_13]|uniref:Uncharacterized protein n=2 Tax=Candidatus Roizmaniibacteriota TaxID=1752723 RepID=A0A2M8EX84_9BACT|nr:MAG: hypothetical protein CO051_05510 [Candidatus Roizmanbacteria bacterium CG_4_9_14_0_2_um_filter_39_13]PJE61981.1 MAG: hypothetical protein COU87_01710 [Candidatus Roizmanbacteria bacterium CG10_big_fil_rev_8_21_14_0_10_39_12]